MLKASVLAQILTNSSCSDLTSVRLPESRLHSLAQILPVIKFLIELLPRSSCSANTCRNLLVQILPISRPALLAQILPISICPANTCRLENLLAQILPRYLAQIWARSWWFDLWKYQIWARSGPGVGGVVCESIKYSASNHVTARHQLLVDGFSLYTNAFCANKIRVNSHSTFVIPSHLISLTSP